MFLTIDEIRAIAGDLAIRINADAEDYQAFVAVSGGYVTSDCWDDVTSLAVEVSGEIVMW